jgi:hypothetical protein
MKRLLLVLSLGLLVASLALLLGQRPWQRAHGRVAAYVGSVPILWEEVRATALSRKEPRSFGAEEAARAVSLEPGREPSREELSRALSVLVDDEALVQEALRRGYDRDDGTVRRRLVARIVEEIAACSGDEVEEEGACCCMESGAPVDPERYRTAAAEARKEAGTWLASDGGELLLAAAREP